MARPKKTAANAAPPPEAPAAGGEAKAAGRARKGPTDQELGERATRLASYLGTPVVWTRVAGGYGLFLPGLPMPHAQQTPRALTRPELGERLEGMLRTAALFVDCADVLESLRAPAGASVRRLSREEIKARLDGSAERETSSAEGADGAA